MIPTRPRIRLFVDAPLVSGGALRLSKEASHYLVTVMRAGVGEEVLLFNGRDGEWRAAIRCADRKAAEVEMLARTRKQEPAGTLTLLFALLKRTRTDLVVEKATELGVARLVPVLSRRAVAERVRPDRLVRIAREAAEQCGRLDLPEILPPIPLSEAAGSGRILLCDRAGPAPPLARIVAAEPHAPWVPLIGPEGGLDPEERTALLAAPVVQPVSLGPRTLRAETAAITALAIILGLREATGRSGGLPPGDPGTC